MQDEKTRREEYSKVNTPQELLSFMSKNIRYGIYGIDNKIHDKWDIDYNSDFRDACRTKYVLCDEDRLLKYGYGQCLDQVEFEKAWFKKHNYEFKTYFIWFNIEGINNYTPHSYLVYKQNNKYYYFEYANFKNKGIYEFDNIKDAILFQMKTHIEFNKSCGNVINDDVLKHIEVYEFNIDKTGIDLKEYMNLVLKSKLIYSNNNFRR